MTAKKPRKAKASEPATYFVEIERLEGCTCVHVLGAAATELLVPSETCPAHRDQVEETGPIAEDVIEALGARAVRRRLGL